MPNETKSAIRCAIYTRKSSEEGLEQSFNSLEAQREACEAYIASQQGDPSDFGYTIFETAQGVERSSDILIPVYWALGIER